MERGENSTDFKSVLVAMNYIVDINERALLKDAYCRSWLDPCRLVST